MNALYLATQLVQIFKASHSFLLPLPHTLIHTVIDSKCDYPAACNAVETILLHESLLNQPAFHKIVSALKQNRVVLHPGPKLARVLPVKSGEVSSMKIEYGGLECSIEVVGSVKEAVEHINNHGSSHTDSIITEDGEYRLHHKLRHVYGVARACVCVFAIFLGLQDI